MFFFFYAILLFYLSTSFDKLIIESDNMGIVEKVKFNISTLKKVLSKEKVSLSKGDKLVLSIEKSVSSNNNVVDTTDIESAKSDLSNISPMSSVLDKSIVELEGMNLSILQTLLYDEIYDLKDEKEDVREVQLRKIFDRLFEIQPKRYLQHFDTDFDMYESRLYIDLISASGIYKIDYVRNFLLNSYESEIEYVEEKRNMLLNIYNYYDNHSEDQIEKFNYILRSSSEVGRRFLTSSASKYDFNEVFPNHFIDLFDKEDLSQLYRFYFCSKSRDNQLKFKFLLKEENKRALFLISEMGKNVKSLIGNDAVFLEPVITLLYSNAAFVNLLNDFYDTYIGSFENEKYFSDMVRKEDLFVFKNIINLVIQSENDITVVNGLFNIGKVEYFSDAVLRKRERYHRFVLGDNAFLKVKNNEYDVEFKEIYNNNELLNFKDAILYNLFGISFSEALSIKKHYGQFVDELSKGISEKKEGITTEEFLDSLDESKMTIKKEDYPSLEVLKAILNIVDLDINNRNFEEKLQLLQKVYLNQIKEKGLETQSFMAASSIVEGLLNKMILNSYNKRLFDVYKEKKVIRIDEGVVLFDAGYDFDMIITSLKGDGALYDDFVNMSSKWNTASMSGKQGLCTSHISSQNLGVIDLTAPILGFSDIPSGSLYSMGPNDIFSKTAYYNLKNNGLGNSNRKFIPGSKMSDETRYGYNEILLDRFLLNDEYNEIKLQPSYVVYYKFDNDFSSRNDEVYRRSLKVANDFGIPIVVVDVLKIKKHEQEELEEMEEKLFSNDIVDQTLFKEIVTRYMNNYTGALSISYFYPNRKNDEFSIDGMRSFFERVEEKVNQSDSSLGLEWFKSLEDVYEDERRKYEEQVDVGSYKGSISRFIFNDFSLGSKINKMRKFLNDKGFVFGIEEIPYINPNSMPEVHLETGKDGTFFSEKTFLPIYKTLISFANALELGTTFEVTDDYELSGNMGTVVSVNEHESAEVLLVEDLVVSYFLEDCSAPALYNSLTDEFDAKFNVDSKNEFNFTEKVLSSSFYSLALDKSSEYCIGLNRDIVEKYMAQIETIDDKKFLNIFKPVMDEKKKKENISLEEIANKMLEKKNSIRLEFSKLHDKLDYQIDDELSLVSTK